MLFLLALKKGGNPGALFSNIKVNDQHRAPQGIAALHCIASSLRTQQCRQRSLAAEQKVCGRERVHSSQEGYY